MYEVCSLNPYLLHPDRHVRPDRHPEGRREGGPPAHGPREVLAFGGRPAVGAVREAAGECGRAAPAAHPVPNRAAGAIVCHPCVRESQGLNGL